MGRIGRHVIHRLQRVLEDIKFAEDTHDMAGFFENVEACVNGIQDMLDTEATEHLDDGGRASTAIPRVENRLCPPPDALHSENVPFRKPSRVTERRGTDGGSKQNIAEPVAFPQERISDKRDKGRRLTIRLDAQTYSLRHFGLVLSSSKVLGGAFTWFTT
jgi:hypothetical protein